jgi:phosphatidylglycerophosphate synthase
MTMHNRDDGGHGAGSDRPAMAPVTVMANRSQARPAFTQALYLLNSAQKPAHGVPAYTRWVNRPLGRFAAAAAANRGISANGVTILSAVFSAAAIACLAFAPATVWLGIVIAVLLAIGYALDSADGQVARLTGSSSPAGEWLDHVVDCVRVPAIHLAVLVGIWQAGVLPVWACWLPLAYTLSSTGHFMSQILAEQLLAARSIPKSQAHPGAFRSWLLLPTDMGTLCWVFVFWGSPYLFIAAYGCLFVLQLTVVVASLRRKYRALSSTGQGALP